MYARVFRGKTIEAVAVRRRALVSGEAGAMQAKEPAAGQGRVCENCGKALQKPLRGPWPRFCGDACRKKASRKKR